MFTCISRAAASRTSTPTKSAATASARGCPRAANTSPTSTAADPARSLAKWSAFEASAALPKRRAVRQETVALLASIAITTPSTRNEYQRTSTCPSVMPASRSTARTEMNTLTSARKLASPSAERCSAFPWPNWCETSAGRAETRTAK